MERGWGIKMMAMRQDSNGRWRQTDLDENRS